MKTKIEFKRFLDTQLFPKLIALDEDRKYLLKKYLIPVAIFVVLAVLSFVVFMLIQGSSQIPLVAMFIFVIIAVIFYFSGKSEINLYKYRFKTEIIGKLVSFIDESLKYVPNAGILEHEYLMSNLFLKDPDRFHSEDLVQGKLGKTEIKFSEVHSEYKTQTTDSKGVSKTEWHTIFKGIFFIADFNKEFITNTVILPDIAEKFFGSFLGSKFQKMNFSRGQLIKLENPEFEKEFAVYGNDQIEARYILTPDLMERILKFKKESKKELYISFLASKMYVAIPYKENLFEPKYFKTIIDKQMIIKYFEILQLVTGIVEEFNLNTRIWGKN